MWTASTSSFGGRPVEVLKHSKSDGDYPQRGEQLIRILRPCIICSLTASGGVCVLIVGEVHTYICLRTDRIIIIALLSVNESTTVIR